MNMRMANEDKLELKTMIEFFMKEKEKKHHKEVEYDVRLQAKKK